jgi:hypothetical protein
MEKQEILEELTIVQEELIDILNDQVIQLSIMSKIELGDDVIKALSDIKKRINEIKEKLNYQIIWL